MALNFTKKKTQPDAKLVITKSGKTAPQVPDFIDVVSDIAELVDRVGSLQDEAKEIKEHINSLNEQLAPYNDAIKELAKAVDDMTVDPDVEHVELGQTYRADCGKRATTREIEDLDMVKKLMGQELFMKLATVALKDIDAYLTPPQKEKVLKINRGRRTIKVTARH